MRKGKRILGASLAVAMAMTSLVGCGGKDNNASGNSKKREGEKVIEVKSTDIGIPKPEAVEKKKDAKKVQLTVWCPVEEQKIMETLCDIFNTTVADYDVSFKIENISEADVANQISNDRNKSADVFMFGGDQLPTMVKQGLIYDISALSEIEYSKGFEKQYDEVALNSCKIDGALYALPFTPNQFFLYYDSSKLTEDDVKSLDTIMAKDLGAGVKNFSMEVSNGWYVASFFYAGGCTLFGEDGTKAAECDWNSENGVAVVKYVRDVITKNKDKFHNNSGTDDALGLLSKGQLASWVSGSWKSNAIKDALKDNYAAASLPTITINGEEKNLKPFADYKMLGVNKVTKEPEVAAMLTYFLADDYAQMLRLQVRSYAPTILDLQEKVLSGNVSVDGKAIDPAVIAATRQITPEHSVARPTTTQLSKYWTIGATLGDMLVQNKEQIQDDKIQATLDASVKAITAGAEK